MAKTYFPHAGKEVLVKASAPHPKNTEYKISIGSETWDDGNHEVVKIQMVYDGVVAGRRSPSFPLGTDDFQRVISKVEKLISNR
jgi:hypothetical protein